jgi:hypothetical protein
MPAGQRVFVALRRRTGTSTAALPFTGLSLLALFAVGILIAAAGLTLRRLAGVRT